MVLVGVAVAVWAGWAAPARATYGARTTADEPQYLLSALSLAEDGDLTISDELSAERWRDFHAAELPVQTQPLADGREVSPHDPLLPLLLAPGVAVGGWLGAKLVLAALAGVLASLLTWTAWRRFGVAPATAAVVVGACAVSAPLVSYGTQVYPELPGALAVAAAVAMLTGDLRRTRLVVGFALAVVALPWLSVKYAPVAAALAVPGLWRIAAVRGRGSALAVVGALAGAAAVFAAVHLAVYDGLTPYAAGDHFAGGELDVMGTEPDRLGRSVRLVGLLVDRDFGLVAWAPVWLLAVPALAALVRRRPPGWELLVLPLVAGWATATWVALTMHGWWWPGRQVVVVLPGAVLAIAWWAGRVPVVRTLAAVAGVIGALSWGWLVVEVLRGDRTLVVDFAATSSPWFRAVHPLLPDGRAVASTRALFVVWGVVVAALGWVGWRSVAPVARRGGSGRSGSGRGGSGRGGSGRGGSGRGGSGRGDEDAGAGEGPDADVAAVDLDGDRAVR